MSTTRLQEVLVCFGKKKQADIATAQVAADMWRFSKLNAALANPKLATENDAEEYGKGHEFPTATFKTAWDVGATLEKYLSAEIGAWAVAFALGQGRQERCWPVRVHLHSADACGWRCRGVAVPLVRRADPARRGRRPRPAGGRPGCRGVPDHRWLRSWPRQQQDQRRTGRVRQGHRLRDRHHDARRDHGEAPAVRFVDALDQRRGLCDQQEHRLPGDGLEEQHPDGRRLLPRLRLPDGGRRVHRRDPRQAGVRQPRRQPEVRRAVHERIGRVHEAQGADHRHGGRDAGVRREQLAPVDVAAGHLLRGRDRGDGPDPHGRGRVPADVPRPPTASSRRSARRVVDAICS